MIVYEATKKIFVEDVVQDKIEENIDRKFYEKMGYHTSKNERKAWTKNKRRASAHCRRNARWKRKTYVPVGKRTYGRDRFWTEKDKP